MTDQVSPLGQAFAAIALVGMAISMATWPAWLLSVIPATREATETRTSLSLRWTRVTWVAAATALAGNLGTMAVEAADAAGNRSWWTTLQGIVTETRGGQLWVLGTALALAIPFALDLADWADPWRRRRAVTVAAILLSIAAPVPWVLRGHFSDVSPGRSFALANGVTHFWATALVAGGVVALVMAFRGWDAASRAQAAGVLPGIRQRALVAGGAGLAVAIATGVYATWLETGAGDALTGTPYGRVVLAKVAVTIAAALLACIAIRHGGAGGGTSAATTIALAVALLAVGALALSGVLGELTPGSVVANPSQAKSDFILEPGGLTATFTTSPGVPGLNHYLLSVDGPPLPEGTNAALKMTSPVGDFTRDVQLERTGSNTFEANRADLSTMGHWQVTVLLRHPDGTVSEDEALLQVDYRGSLVKPPTSSPRFDLRGLGGWLLALAGLVAVVSGLLVADRRLRREVAALGSVALVGGVLLMVGSENQNALAVRYPANPVAATGDSVSRGATLYTISCESCHGPNGIPDRTMAARMDPPPTNFTDPHTALHSDGQLFAWISEGIEPTMMTAYGDRLSDDEIWDIINYLRTLQ